MLSFAAAAAAAAAGLFTSAALPTAVVMLAVVDAAATGVASRCATAPDSLRQCACWILPPATLPGQLRWRLLPLPWPLLLPPAAAAPVPGLAAAALPALAASTFARLAAAAALVITLVCGSSAGLGLLQLVDEQHKTCLTPASCSLAYSLSSRQVLELRGM
ncbi:hypothetical protein COO60DRAFT_1498293 [Scenedesmus sp. NREL 46B-D3]|nr:hypothetical protein COO60DRAFT_1498293 [Scenedesmus sp. NREL 46B-D3]